MKEFDMWWKENNYLYMQPISYGEMKMCWDDAHKAGMLAAADIADKYAFKIQSKDSAEYAIGNNIGEAIRRKANVTY